MKGGNFKIRSFNEGGVGIIVVERINKKFVIRNAHMSATAPAPVPEVTVFNASDGPFLTAEGYRIIVKNS